MPSPSDPEGIDFERGVVTTAQDIEALDRLRRLNYLSPPAYLDFLLTFTSKHPPTRDIPENHEPFEL